MDVKTNTRETPTMYHWYSIKKNTVPSPKNPNIAATHEEQAAVPKIPAVNPENPPTTPFPAPLIDFLIL